MKQAIITLNLYTLDELNEAARARAIEDHRHWLLNNMTVEDFEGCGDPELDTPESMYNEEYNYILTEDEGVIESIEINEYLFFENGEMAWTINYCGNHPRAGESVLRFGGKEYSIT